MMTRNFILAVAAAAPVSFGMSASAGVVFDNLTQGSSYSTQAGTTDIYWNSVYVSNTTGATSLSITQIKGLMYKTAGYSSSWVAANGAAQVEVYVAKAFGTDLTNYYPTFSSPSGGAASGSQVAGAVSLGAVTAASISTVTWTPSAAVTVQLNSAGLTNQSCFFVGFRLVNNSGAKVGVLRSLSATPVTSGAFTDNAYWKSATNLAGATSGPFASSTAGAVNTSAYQISGDLVPAPGALALLGVAGILGSRRRR